MDASKAATAKVALVDELGGQSPLEKVAFGSPEFWRAIGYDVIKNSPMLAVLVGALAASTLTFLFPLPPSEMLGLYALAVLPQVVAICALGSVRIAVPFRTLGLLSLVSLLGAYVLLVTSRATSQPISDEYTLALLVVALSPQFAALWATMRAPVEPLGKPPLPVLSIGLVSIVSLLVLALLSIMVEVRADLTVAPWILCTTFVVALMPPIIANWIQARRERRIPISKLDKQPDHISGMGATALIFFVVVIVTLGLWATATGTTARIDKLAGSIVIFGLAFAFLVVAMGPHLPASKLVGSLMQIMQALVKPLGKIFSWADSLMVFPIAGTLGATQSSLWLRYALLLGNLIPCALLGWWLSAPYGLVPLAMALIGTIAIARRWSWIEEDRENAMLNRQFEGAHIRVGFEQDLRDETLIGFMALLFLVPLILRQLQLSIGDVFVLTGDVLNSPLAWLSFFGTELAKALPFVDWAEVYHVEGNAAIHVSEQGVGVGQHVIFATRILVDLVLLAAFLQAISITQRSRKLKDMFYKEGTIDRLDPFIESAELRTLMSRGPDGFVFDKEKADSFPRYDADRLEKLRQRGERDEVGFVANRLLERYSNGPPEVQLRREAMSKKPSRDVCDALIDQLHLQPSVNILSLKAAHFAFNSKVSFWPVRLSLATLIGERTDDPAAINALSEILMGPGPGVADPRSEVRFAALLALYRPAIQGNPVAHASIKRAAEADAALRVKSEALRMLKDLGGDETTVPLQGV